MVTNSSNITILTLNDRQFISFTLNASIWKNIERLDTGRSRPNVSENNSQRITAHGIIVYIMKLPWHYAYEIKIPVEYFSLF